MKMAIKRFFSSSLVIGGSGAVGNLFVQNLRETFPDLKISVLDLIEPKQQILNVRYEYNLDRYIEEFKEFDLVILALPEAAAITVLQDIKKWLKSDALVVDTLSVKSNICSKVKTLSIDAEYVSVNPMFAPNIGFSNQTVLVIPVQTGDSTANFLALLGEWGATVKTLTVDEHDIATAQLQSLTHATIMAFGLALIKGGYDIDQLLSIAPPPHKIMLSLIARILSGSPDVYRDIQCNNPHASDVRASLVDSINTIDDLITQGSYSDFADLFDEFKVLLSDRLDVLTEQCKVVFKSLS